jgi:hypothetical protein
MQQNRHGWSGHKPLIKKYPDFEQRLSNKGQNFTMLHIQIRNFEKWLRGVHSYCNKTYMEQYIQEYLFRFNRLNFRSSILEKLLVRMVKIKPMTCKSIKYSSTLIDNPIVIFTKYFDDLS